jgi:CBS-domain-containing membrane protein
MDIKHIQNKPVKQISSDLISVEEDYILKDAIFTMLDKRIRNLGIIDKKSKVVGIINDRNILEFLLNPTTRMIGTCKYDSLSRGNIEKEVDPGIIGSITIKKI